MNKRVHNLFPILFSIIYLLITGSLSAQTLPVFNAPDFMSGVYDQYSSNKLNTSMAGRGNTGLSIPGGVEAAWYNPALLKDYQNNFYIEAMLKDKANEFNTLDNQKYQSLFPLSFVGINYFNKKKDYFSISYSMVNSLYYYSFDRVLYGIGDLYYQPSYYNHQVTLTGNHEFNEKYSVGMNLLVNFHQFIEYRNEGKVDRLNFTEPIIRLQPGFLSKGDYFSYGFSFTPPVKYKIDHSYLHVKSTIPTVFRAGSSYRYNDFLVALDADYTLYSQQDSDFKNQLVLKTGAEYRNDIYTYRGGLLYSPCIFEGDYAVPDFSDPAHTEFHSNFYAAIPESGSLKNTDMALLTAGVSIKPLPDAELNLAVMRDIMGHVKITQLMSSIKFNLKIFEKLKKE